MDAPSTLRPVSDAPHPSLLTLICNASLSDALCALCGEMFGVAPWRAPTGRMPGAPKIDICGRCRT